MEVIDYCEVDVDFYVLLNIGIVVLIFLVYLLVDVILGY